MDLWALTEADWANLPSSRQAATAVRGWSAIAPAFAGFASPAEVVASITRMGDASRSCALLADLLVVAKRDELAARATLSAVVPGLRAAARRRWWAARADGPWRDQTELDADTLTAGWHAIGTHAGRQYERPATVIVRAVEGQLRRAHDAHRRHQARYPPAAYPPAGAAQSGLDVASSADEQLAGLITDAVAAGALDRPSGAIIFAVGVLGCTAADAGRLLGIEPTAVYRNLTRARTTLAMWAQGARPASLARTPAPLRPKQTHAPQAARPHHDDTSLFLDPDPDGECRLVPEEDSPMPPLLLTIGQTAEMLGIGRTMVYDLMSSGELESCKLAKKCRRIPYESAVDYVRRMRENGGNGSSPQL